MKGQSAVSTRTLQGVGTIWSDNSLVPGPRGSNVTVALAINDDNGQVKVNLQPMDVGNNIILRQNGDGVGHYDFNSGNLEVNIPFHVDHVPVGRILDASLHLSTALSISPPNLGSIAGIPAGTPSDATGSITLVGNTRVIYGIDSLFGFIPTSNNAVWVRVLGTLFPT
jgi:hypothetical protein